MARIELRNVSMTFGSNGTSTHALDSVSLQVHDGEFIALIGPSGCGKSTLLDLVAGLRNPTGGLVAVDGEEIRKPGPDRGIVFQDYSLFPWMSALENISFALEHSSRRQSKKESLAQARKYLEIIGLSRFSDRYPGTLSGGMRQRLAIARMFAMDPRVFLMDEPFGALDSLNRVYMQDLLTYLWTQGELRKTVLFVTHDVDEALLLSDRIAVMTPAPGKIKEIIEVPFHRPRCRPELNSSPEYIALRSKLLALLYEEMLGDIARQEKEMRRLK
jgi:NitT/TauT family transport system ATP-binding protein